MKLKSIVKDLLWKIKLNLNMTNVFSVIIIGFLIYTVLYPLYIMLSETFIVHPMERFRVGKEIGSFTFFHWIYNFFSEMSMTAFYKPFLNSLIIATAISLLALIIGGVLAFLVVRTNMPFKKMISNAALLPYIMPSWTLALAWMTVFKNPRVGGTPGIFQSLTGYILPNWFSFGILPIIICLSLHYFPFGFMLLGGALNRIDTRLEESAELLGASRVTIIKKIIIPLLTPVIFSTILLTFTRGLGTFGAPHFLGGPVNFYVLSTRLESSLVGQRVGSAYIVAFIMILMGILILYMDQKVIGARKSFVTVSGKGGDSNKIDLGKYKNLIAVLALIFVIASSVIPISILAIDSFMLIPGHYELSNFSLHNWIGEATREFGLATGERGILLNSRFQSAMLNTLQLGFITAIITGIIGILVGHTVVRLRGTKFANFLDQLSFLPYMIPSIAFGSIILALFAVRRGPIPSLYGSFWLLVVACVVKYLPYSTRAGIGAMRQIGPELEESAILFGANWFTRMKRIIFPLQKHSFFSGMLLPFISAMRELSLVVLLVSPGNQVITSITVMYTERGWYPIANGVTTLLILIIIMLVSLSRFLMGTDLSKGLGG
ncbi:hypothetical protein HSACCH_02359 [Halanaerobium saccharolyticum subsp. saccharolyticum DSM 6643]|uniref:ABC transmembrane type-1 domain-containing protein n=1 Tax=Halanaerobium saccharolyticum subsp. saccharolyticum DSM 6643 TaxID=1293054 RepID=M5E3G9_9FIRM|nr:iron ABC transporter permease [Halanaerobium saccharolyticum]CCU80844.1 hypothetical protein HSACCH_02359 [Halanaerobium saccharolyticum subsp. saccharolyticum DSM 6643]